MMLSLRPGIAAVFGGAISALLFVAIQTGSLGGTMLFCMAQLPLFLVALSFGAGFGAAAAAWAFAMMAVSISLPDALEYAVLMAIPVLAITAAASRGPKPNAGFMIQALVGIVVTAFVAADLVNIGANGGLEGRIRLSITTMISAIHQGSGAWVNVAMLNWMAAIVPGVFGCTVMLFSLGNGVLAQGALARFGWNCWAAPRMSQLTVSRLVSVAFALALAAGLAGSGEVSFLGTNLAMMTAVPLMLVGFAVVHYWTEKHSAYWPVVPGLYVLSFAFGWPIPLIVTLGVVEQWFGLRRRMADPTEEKFDG